ncbi:MULTISPECIES: MATE family efflux transporter [unclassified Actinomyces]|uniref:MATE family efflux transporter n=1 Tax=unclassified Actinomyces TaxID=2609248 RepID=UPI0009F40E47|nr:MULTISPECIES: MATE family efflux transporter [unclassified Actinomyces]MDU6679138.1 MATE family efflux transporter [Actinomyces sp.]
MAQHSSKTEPQLEGLELNREILRLALPALGALLAQPLFTTIDSAMVGHLGTEQLAGLALSSTILMTAVGLFIFLAYSTTSITARALGAGNIASGLRAGIEAIWLAALLGVITASALILAAPIIISWFRADTTVIPHAIAYLQYSSPGLVGMLVVLAATGTLRGLLDTKTPLYVATAGAAGNAALNAIFIYGLDMGIAGSGLGTAIAQTLMGIILVAVVVKGARREGVSLKPSFGGLLGATNAGLPLLVRTLTLRIAILATVAVVTRAGAIALAAHQVVNTVWNFAAFALDALGISAQSLTGYSIGTGDRARTRALVRRITIWGVATGAVLGLVIIAASGLLPWIFGTDPTMHSAAMRGLWIAGGFQVLAGFVFMMDGVLIGAGDNRFLAVAGILTLVPYLPVLWIILEVFADEKTLTATTQTTVLMWVWVAFAGIFMGARALTTGLRVRGSKWIAQAEETQ